MKPWRFFVLIEPPAIGNVNVVPEAVAGLIGATAMWLSDSSFAAAADAVIVVVPPVIFVCAADATPGSTRANAVVAMARTRIRIMELPSRLSVVSQDFDFSEHTRLRRVAMRSLGRQPHTRVYATTS